MQLTHQGTAYRVTFTKGVLHTVGEFGGNIDLELAFEPAMDPDTAVNNVFVRVPGLERTLGVLGHEPGTALNASFHDPSLEGCDKDSLEVEILWAQMSVGTVTLEVLKTDALES